jgi:hypothetical protein
MYALEPPLFQLLAKHLQLINSRLARQYPAVHYGVLKTLYSHCAPSVIYLGRNSFYRIRLFLDMNILFIIQIYLNKMIQIV